MLTAEDSQEAVFSFTNELHTTGYGHTLFRFLTISFGWQMPAFQPLALGTTCANILGHC